MTSTEGKDVVGRQIKYHNGYVYGYWGTKYIERYTSDSLDVAGVYETNKKKVQLYFIDFNDQFLFAAGSPGIIFQWKLETQTLVNSYTIPKEDDLEITTIKVYKKMLFVASEIPGETGRVDVWDFTTGNKIHTIKYEPKGDTTIEAAKDVLYVVTGTRCNMYDTKSGKRFKTIDYDDEFFIHPIPNGDDPEIVYFCMSIYLGGITVISYNHSTTTFGYIVISDEARVIRVHENYIYYCTGKKLNVVKLALSDKSDEAELRSDRHEIKEVVKMEKNIDTFAIGANNIYMKFDDDVQIHPLPNFISNYEEDSDIFTSYHTDSESIGSEGGVDKCLDQNLIMLEPYSVEDNPLLIYLPNSKGKFGSPNCTTKEELEQYFKTFIGNAVPDNIMTIYTSPSFPTETGHGSEPTGKIVVKLPMNNIYVTLGSIRRVMSSKNTEWYALPIYDGKRRRVGNLKGLFAASMNHGQAPGYRILKLFTRAEILQGVEVKEDEDDYPLFFVESAKELYELLGYKDVTADFTDKIINMIIGS